MACKKCANPANVLLRKKDTYCDSCFITNINHKFRACIGKNKLFSKNEKVLICFSGGKGSTVLLDLVHTGICMDNHKKMRVAPEFVHLIDAETESLSQTQYIIKQCNKYNFDVHLVHMCQYFEPDLQLPATNSIPDINNVIQDQFNTFIQGIPATTSNDIIQKIQRALFIKCAQILNCSFVITGETTTTLAINLLSNLALGRGSQVEHDVGFCDARNKTIKIIKPMKEITQEELNYYSNLKHLTSITQNNQTKSNSLQSVIGLFVTDLQENFPATISTVCKTADKIGIHDKIESKKKCCICESDLGTENSKITALEASQFSRSISTEKSITDTIELEKIKDEKRSLFPHVHKHLCYGCSRIYPEIKDNLPHHVKTLY